MLCSVTARPRRAPPGGRARRAASPSASAPERGWDCPRAAPRRRRSPRRRAPPRRMRRAAPRDAAGAGPGGGPPQARCGGRRARNRPPGEARDDLVATHDPSSGRIDRSVDPEFNRATAVPEPQQRHDGRMTTIGSGEPAVAVQDLTKRYGDHHRPRRRLVRHRAGRDVRAARPERRRQDDDHRDPRGLPRPHRRRGPRARGRPGTGGVDWKARLGIVLQIERRGRHRDGPRAAHPLRLLLPATRATSTRRSTRSASRRRRSAHPRALRRPAAPSGCRARHHRAPRAAVPRRADDRLRPGGAAPVLGPDPRRSRRRARRSCSPPTTSTRPRSSADRAGVIADGTLVDIGPIDAIGRRDARVPVVRWRDADGLHERAHRRTGTARRRPRRRGRRADRARGRAPEPRGRLPRPDRATIDQLDEQAA